MPALRNAKHERFAEELARGRSASEAYRTIFGKDNRRYASALGQREDISGRVQDILSERSATDREATAKAAEALSIDKQWVMSRLQQNAETALGNIEVKGRILCKEGGSTMVREVEFMDRDPAAANRALELLGKELGMFIDRSEVNTVIRDVSDEPLSEDDWAKKHATAH